MWRRHWRTELRKHVFPTLSSPRAILAVFLPPVSTGKVFDISPVHRRCCGVSAGLVEGEVECDVLVLATGGASIVGGWSS